MIERSPILITSAGRSGAGIIGGILHQCGVFGGKMTNKRGLYENDEIRESLVKKYLVLNGNDPEGQYNLPNTQSLNIPMTWRNDVERILLSQGYSSGPWMYKDARMALIWPIWHYAFPNAKWLIVRRRTGDIIQSCTKTAYMSAFKSPSCRKKVGVESEEDGWLWWVHEYEKRFVEMMNEGVNCKIIWPERMVDGDYTQLQETLEWLGLKWNSEIINFVSPLLWKSRMKKGG